MVALALALAPATAAAPPAVTASASPGAGVSPLRVTLTASGDAAAYSWALGDGATAVGPVVTHTYRAGRHVAVVTATDELGETAQAQVVVTVTTRTLSLEAPPAAQHDAATVLAGALQPAVPGARVQIYRGRTYVTSASVQPDGRFRTMVRLRAPGAYEARYGKLRSAPRAVTVRPALSLSVPPLLAVGDAHTATAQLVPPSSGALSIRVLAGTRVVARQAGRGVVAVPLPTRVARALRIVVESRPAAGYVPVRRELRARVVLPRLGYGSRGPAVLSLERRLAELRYALRGADTVYGSDTVEAVLAFQKVHGLRRTGRVDDAFWRRLAAAGVPRPRSGGGDHIEVDKTRNVLYEIVGGGVHRIVHVSTGATGNTPVGTFHVYRKVGGWDWILWYPMYFLRGFAIHGYPSVPAYPASHGCVRVPMWLAPSLFSRHGYGTRVVVFT